jgi:mannose-6-phosphate isomerase-like protein (cupin superfamily)
MKIKFDATEYLDKLKKNNSYFHTFIDKKSLAAGVIFLNPGENDTQDPHDSDEIYYILEGNGFLEIKDKSYHIKGGEIYFVAKGVTHHFYGNTKNLSVLYFFGGSNS